MTEIKPAGYQDLRNYIEANWEYIELRDDQGSAIVRLPITDDRVEWTHTPGAQTLEMTVTINGSDPDISLPQTVAGSALYKAASGGDAMSEKTFVPFTLMAAEDEITIRHQIQVPEVV